jgi:hypothetical protein
METVITILEEIDNYLIPGPWWAQGPNIWGPDGDRVASCDSNLALAPHLEAEDAARGLAALRNTLPAWRALLAEMEIVLARPAGLGPDEKDLAILREALATFKASLSADPLAEQFHNQRP